MYIESLIIKSGEQVIRNIQFRNGINFIVDNSKGKTSISRKNTTNSIGKTTVLKLIDVCFGADRKIIYQDLETKKNEDHIIKEFIENSNININLNLNDGNRSYSIFRNLSDDTYDIDGKQMSKKEFLAELRQILFPNLADITQPTVRQLLKKNIRIDNYSINNVLQFLSPQTKKSVYESLHLTLFGIVLKEVGDKTKLLSEKTSCENIKKELLGTETLVTLEQLLSNIESEIEEYNLELKKYKKIEQITFEELADELNNLKRESKILDKKIENLKYQLNLHMKIKEELLSNKFTDDKKSVLKIYDEYALYFEKVMIEFEKLVLFHDSMTNQRIEYTEELIQDRLTEINNCEIELSNLRKEILSKVNIVENSQEFVSFEKIKNELQHLFVMQGKYTEIIDSVKKRIDKIHEIEKQINKIDELIQQKMNEFKENIDCFNKYYAYFSRELYGVSYRLIYDFDKKNTLTLSSSTSSGTSSGKKQGEILCFDFAYILFAREKEISHVDFILNDKKELLDSTIILKAVELARENNIQLVFSILSDKLSSIFEEVQDNIILELSEEDKLFKV